MPLIGKIKISELSQEAAENAIEDRYSDGFIKFPCVLLHVTKRAREQVTVLGNVQTQGVIEFDSNHGMTLIEALGRANGATLKGDISKVILTSMDANGQIKSKQIDIKLIINGKAKDIELKDGDLVYVKESIF
jgi:protein involved in polysaccharide export with SLBB domain